MPLSRNNNPAVLKLPLDVDRKLAETPCGLGDCNSLASVKIRVDGWIDKRCYDPKCRYMERGAGDASFTVLITDITNDERTVFRRTDREAVKAAIGLIAPPPMPEPVAPEIAVPEPPAPEPVAPEPPKSEPSKPEPPKPEPAPPPPAALEPENVPAELTAAQLDLKEIHGEGWRDHE